MAKTNIENIILPSDWDVSRIQMTHTNYKFFKSRKNIINYKTIEKFDFMDFKKKYDKNISYFHEKDFHWCKSISEKILRIITSPKYRSGWAYLINLDKYTGIFLKNIEHFISKNEPVKFMLPAFPFKIKNPLKSSRWDADLAEVASFCKFNEINLQIQKIYSPWAQFYIFHDGHLYYRHFLHTKKDAEKYFSSLKNFIKKLGLEKIVFIKDAYEELKKFDNLTKAYKIARKEMNNLRKYHKQNEKIIQISNSARNNINLSSVSIDILLKIFSNKKIVLNKDLIVLKKEIFEKSWKCAFEYMVVQHMLEKLDFFNKLVPNWIRLTVHPKEWQIWIHLVKKTTFLLPWMWVGLLKKDWTVSVRYESELKDNASYTPIYIKGENKPFYYQQI